MANPLHLFEGFGVELEYMIVDQESLDVRPLSDQILKSIAGEYVSEVELNSIAWCNEVVLHVVELKTNGPARSLSGLHGEFLANVRKINGYLRRHSACLLPTGMHPWMDPHKETVLWPHEYSPVYESYNRIFGCQGHGWSNLQSLHLNLPFDGDEEFGRLHAAIRVLLPILPGIAASSPLADGRMMQSADYRLEVYRKNQIKVPSITGSVIPEPVFSEQEYREQILERIYKDIAPYDPEEILRNEWLNSRGAIARFERGTIEVRLLDIQECPLADLAIYGLIVKVLQSLVEERWASFSTQKSWTVEPLSQILSESILYGGDAVVNSEEYLSLFGLAPVGATAVHQIWSHLIKNLMDDGVPSEWVGALGRILEQGTLSARIRKAVGSDLSKKNLKKVYRELARCLDQGVLFDGAD